jgi:hypothetical protein
VDSACGISVTVTEFKIITGILAGAASCGGPVVGGREGERSAGGADTVSAACYRARAIAQFGPVALGAASGVNSGLISGRVGRRVRRSIRDISCHGGAYHSEDKCTSEHLVGNRLLKRGVLDRQDRAIWLCEVLKLRNTITSEQLPASEIDFHVSRSSRKRAGGLTALPRHPVRVFRGPRPKPRLPGGVGSRPLRKAARVVRGGARSGGRAG